MTIDISDAPGCARMCGTHLLPKVELTFGLHIFFTLPAKNNSSLHVNQQHHHHCTKNIPYAAWPIPKVRSTIHTRSIANTQVSHIREKEIMKTKRKPD